MTLATLQAQHPDWCFTCGKYWLDPGGIHTCFDNPVIAALKQLINEQAVKIAELGNELAAERALTFKAKEEVETKTRYWTDSRAEVEKFKEQLEEIHGLIDNCPGVLPRTTIVPPKNDWERETKRENSIMLRLASFMGVHGKA